MSMTPTTVLSAPANYATRPAATLPMHTMYILLVATATPYHIRSSCLHSFAGQRGVSCFTGGAWFSHQPNRVLKVGATLWITSSASIALPSFSNAARAALRRRVHAAKAAACKHLQAR
jgi:hypothetical protein